MPINARLLAGMLLLCPALLRAENVLTNGDFSGGTLAGWTPWIVRNNGGDFAATVSAGELTVSGTDVQGGVYQQFDTGGPGNVIDVVGAWRSNPTALNDMWAEVWVINGARAPQNGVAEMDGASNAILLYRNDTLAGRPAWNGRFPHTAPVKYQSSFVAAGNLATIVLCTGNSGAGVFSGVTFDDVSVSRVAPPGTPSALPPGFASRTCLFPVSGVAVMGQHPINRKIYAIQNGGSSSIYKIDPAQTTLSAVLVRTIGSAGLEFTGGCQGMTFDASGNLYVSSHDGDILKGTYVPATESFNFSVLIDLDETRVGGDHGVGGLAIGPDNRLYINSGSLLHGTASQGVEPDNGLNARILRANLDGTNVETFCTGSRNHFDIAFRTDGKLVGVENGPDCHYGDEINILEQGNHYGYPYKYGSDVSGSDSTLDAACIFTPPVGLVFTPALANYGPNGRPGPGQNGYVDGGVYFGLNAHSSPDGLCFYEPSRMRNDVILFPPEYWGRAFVARFGQSLGVPGSAGFDVLSVRFDDAGQGFFCNTFLSGMGRAIDVVAADNGRLYILEFNQQAVFGGSGGGTPSRLTEIRYTIPAGPRIATEPVSIARTVDIGTTLPPGNLAVWNAGTGALNFTAGVSGNPSWLSSHPAGGQSADLAGSVPLSLTWNTASLAAGTLTTSIVLTDPAAGNSPLTIPVSLTVKTVLPDFDGDGDVDQVDFALQQRCFSTFVGEAVSPLCAGTDLNRDATVGLSDLNIFLACMSGAEILADKTCDDAWE